MGQICSDQNDFDQARRHYEETLALCEQTGDVRFAAFALNNLDVLAARQDDVARAESLYQRSLAIRRELNDPVGLAATLEGLGTLAQRRGDPEAAERFYKESLALHRQMQDQVGIVLIRLNQAMMALKHGDLARAGSPLAEALMVLQRDGNRRYTAYAFEVAATLAGRQHRFEHAARLWGAADALRQAIHSPLTELERNDYDEDVARVCAALGEPAWAAAQAQGRALSLEQAFADAREGAPPPDPG